MNESFDPYHRWLGIAPEEQPANHYRLLGLKQFESDADVIESAADRQMAHVRGFQSGQHADDAQRVLNEISKAKLVLLKPEERAKYEAQLKAQSGSKVREPKLAQALPLPTAAAPTSPPPKRPAPKNAVVSSVPTKSGGPNIVLLVAVPAVIFLILVGGTLAYLVFPRGEVDGVTRNDVVNPPAVVTVPPVVTPANDQRPEPIDKPTPEPNEVTPKDTATNEPPNIAEPESPIPSDPIEPAIPDDGEFIAAAPEAQPPVIAGPKKNPVPDKAARDAARVKIDNIFSLADADTREKKAALAQQMLKVAGDTKDDSVAQFVLLNMARELAAENAQARLAMQAVDQLQSNFDFDTSAVRMATLGTAVKSPFPPTEKHEVLAVGIEMIDAMMQRDEYEAAGQLAVALLDIGRRARNKELLDALTDRRTRAGELLAEYKKMDAAFTTLKTDPENADANLLVGRYLTCVKQDWERGLPHLSKGSDAVLAAAAKAELESPPDPDAQLLDANAWWAAAEADKDKQARLVCLSQSGHWYREAVDKLTGLNKAQAQQRLGEITSQLAGATVAARPDPRPPRKPQGPAIAKITVKEMQTGPLVIKEGMPAELNGATTFDWTPSAKKGNAVEFTVDESGLLIMITSFPETKYEGNNSGGWYESRLTRKQLVEGGWREVANRTWAPGYFMYARAVEKGQSYRIHTNKYGTPRLILPRSDQDPPPEAEDEPDLGVFSRPPTGNGATTKDVPRRE